MPNTDNKSIFISGGAAGIGRAVAEKFLAAGWTVGAYDIDEKSLEALKSEHPEIITGKLDVTDYDQWEAALADFTGHTGGRLDVLDNNAGILADGDITDQTPEQIAAQITINCTGLTYGAKAAHPYLTKTKGSHLVNMSSASGIYGQPHLAPYSASKFYVGGFSQAIDLEWRKDKIRVVNIMPLWTHTKLANVSTTSIKRLGVNIQPEDVADAVWKAVHPKNFLERRRRDYSVSTMDLLLRYGGRLAPAVISREVNKLIAG
ncbi:MAG TPA: SDR family oxidoreductase [Candidatus Corynebacterium gallistercoris]|uniref:SDR family oxidoreductase n=1 Tax=Candidatus Corynebacterium gallistercoris TaxID=2838530 RepID=A0A9D1UPE8_9CORY|nr:SDR family oxidoreductase [Candidatus Corynebacterium gallistercoris]